MNSGKKGRQYQQAKVQKYLTDWWEDKRVLKIKKEKKNILERKLLVLHVGWVGVYTDNC